MSVVGCFGIFGVTWRDPEEVLGVLGPDHREATGRNVAVNGVMAGCRPEHMPVLLAVVACLADPEFRVQDAGSAPGWEPLVVLPASSSVYRAARRWGR